MNRRRFLAAASAAAASAAATAVKARAADPTVRTFPVTEEHPPARPERCRREGARV